MEALDEFNLFTSLHQYQKLWQSTSPKEVFKYCPYVLQSNTSIARDIRCMANTKM